MLMLIDQLCPKLFATPWTVAHQGPLSMKFSRQGYWSGLPFPFPGDLPHPGIKSGFPALQADFFFFLTIWATRETQMLDAYILGSDVNPILELLIPGIEQPWKLLLLYSRGIGPLCKNLIKWRWSWQKKINIAIWRHEESRAWPTTTAGLLANSQEGAISVKTFWKWNF